jgi:2-iminobutanoate/2-iminopropanoate deaminase
MNAITRYPSPLPLPFSRATRAGGFLFLSGQIPMDANGQVVRGDIGEQTHAALARIEETLALAGATLKDVVRVTVWLSDLDLFAQFNDAYRSHFPSDFPSRSTVEAKLAMDVDVEIEAQAWLGGTPAHQSSVPRYASGASSAPGPVSEA